jgi:hypothetical protein
LNLLEIKDERVLAPPSTQFARATRPPIAVSFVFTWPLAPVRFLRKLWPGKHRHARFQPGRTASAAARGNSGIGLAISTALAEAGMNVVVAGRRQNQYASVARDWLSATQKKLTHVQGPIDRFGSIGRARVGENRRQVMKIGRSQPRRVIGSVEAEGLISSFIGPVPEQADGRVFRSALEFGRGRRTSKLQRSSLGIEAPLEIDDRTPEDAVESGSSGFLAERLVVSSQCLDQAVLNHVFR